MKERHSKPLNPNFQSILAYFRKIMDQTLKRTTIDFLKIFFFLLFQYLINFCAVNQTDFFWLICVLWSEFRSTKSYIWRSLCSLLQVTLVDATRLTLDWIRSNHHLSLLSGFYFEKNSWTHTRIRTQCIILPVTIILLPTLPERYSRWRFLIND